MTATLLIARAGSGLSLQDGGRPGFLARGLSRGGAMDPIALARNAALLAHPAMTAALEVTAAGARIEPHDAALTLAFTGAPTRLTIAGRPAAWNASHRVAPGEQVDLAATGKGSYAYIGAAGGFDAPSLLGSKSAHQVARLGQIFGDGDMLAIASTSSEDRAGLMLDPPPPDTGPLRILAGAQTHLFPQTELDRFTETEFRKSTRTNRMGAALDHDGAEFGIDGSFSITSEAVVPGDIQIVGTGQPFVLMAECQTTGGYPRIGTVISADLPRMAQIVPGRDLRFQFVSLEEALTARRAMQDDLSLLRDRVRPLMRDPHDIADLLAYQLVSGVTAGEGDV